MPNLPETLAGAPKTDREKRAAELKRIIPTPKPSEYFATRQPKKGFWARLFGR